MQVIPSRRDARPRASLLTAVGGSLSALALLGLGLAFGYLEFSTSIVGDVMGHARAGAAEVGLGIVVWAVALTAPACLVTIGLIRFIQVVPMPSRTSRHTLSSLAAAVSDDYVAATRVRLPDGRVIPELVIGPHGIAVFEELPPAGATRRRAGAWEVRMANGRWMPLENPLDRAARDAERVRRWLAGDERDFVVKVYAAVIDPGASIPRTPACAVIARHQVPAFLASLPPQRSMTEPRLQRIVERVRGAT